MSAKSVAPTRLVLGHGLRPRQVVVGHVIPRIVEATIIPSAIFYVAWQTLGVWPALASALLWAAAVIVRRVVRTGKVPPLVVITTLGLTVRTLVSVVSGSMFFYFLQPVLVTAGIAAAFFVSVAVGRPFVRRLAQEFCPLSDEVSKRHTMQRFFRALTLLWGVVLLGNAVTSFVVLLTVSANTFVIVKTALTPALVILGAATTIIWSIRVARREGIAGAALVAA
jgi:intracellular septation protein A